MGSKNKLKRFKENETFQNVIQPQRQVLERDEFHLKVIGIKLISRMIIL